ncbi:MAG: hypothetical protein OXT65_09260 [Alphaproteobacteria bacterium]|nr:hypothetical protein [Alphaproteobacteria bacterium]
MSDVPAINHNHCRGIESRTAGMQPVCTKPGGFKEFLKGLVDIVNPLQHIPLVGTAYRALTGDDIAPVARVAGGVLYGGPVGGMTSMAGMAVEKAALTGAGGIAMAFAGSPERIADAEPTPPQPQPYRVADIVWDDPAPKTEPRHQIARDMMEALDKYKAMKQNAMALQVKSSDPVVPL